MDYLASVSWSFYTDEESGGMRIVDNEGKLVTPEIANEMLKLWLRFIDYYGVEVINDANRMREQMRANMRPLDKIIKDQSGYVYVLEGPGIYKIGKTSRTASERLAEFAPKLPFETKLICSIATPDASALEIQLHLTFSEKRIRGEWFKLDAKDIEYLLGYAAESRGSL